MIGPNISAAFALVQQLAQQGVQTFCLCPGARNAPFVMLLSRTPGLEVFTFYDERSAGFFALGRIKRDRRPVAVLTTSGTAVSELQSAVAEAYYSQLPLVVLSSDRPAHLRHTGAPQTMDHTVLFSQYIEEVYDFPAATVPRISLASHRPTHINICFDEPLMDGALPSYLMFPQGKTPQSQATLSSVTIEDFLSQSKEVFSNPLVVVSGLSRDEREALVETVQNLRCPVFLEALSGLRPSCFGTSEYILPADEKAVQKLLRSGEVKSVIRVGDVPLGRFWRDLESLKLPVLSVSSKPFPGLSHSLLLHRSLDQNIWDDPQNFLSWKPEQKKHLEVSSQALQQISNYPRSEQNLFQRLLQEIPKEDRIYVGNSLPVRWLDWLDDQHEDIHASRGLNGIDGQISTGLGLLQPEQTLWVVLGDLTTLYDFSGFWILRHPQLKNSRVRVVVINNRGGQIFSQLFNETLFLNEHNLDFEPIAKMWGLDYCLWSGEESLNHLANLQLIEISPDPEQTRQLRQSLRAMESR